MNIALTNGKIPIQTGDERHPIMLVDPLDRRLFDSLFYRGVPAARKDVYWRVLHARLDGKTMREVGETHGISRERVRQMEAKMLRMLSVHYQSVLALEIDSLETVLPLHDNR